MGIWYWGMFTGICSLGNILNTRVTQYYIIEQKCPCCLVIKGRKALLAILIIRKFRSKLMSGVIKVRTMNLRQVGQLEEVGL